MDFIIYAFIYIGNVMRAFELFSLFRCWFFSFFGLRSCFHSLTKLNLNSWFWDKRACGWGSEREFVWCNFSPPKWIFYNTNKSCWNIFPKNIKWDEKIDENKAQLFSFEKKVKKKINENGIIFGVGINAWNNIELHTKKETP